MRFYALYDKNGEISMASDVGYGFEITEDALKISGKEIKELTEKEYDLIKDNLQFFKIDGDKLIERSQLEKDRVIKIRKDSRKDPNQELLKRIDKLENENN